MRRYIILLFIMLGTTFQLDAHSFNKKHVVISQIMYDSPLNEQIGIVDTPYSNGEYIQLYNPETVPVNLTGWKLTGGGSTEIYDFPANTIMEPGSMLVVAYQYNNSGFQLADIFIELNINAYGGIRSRTFQILYQRKIILSNSGETISLIDSEGDAVDHMTYDGTSNKTKPNRLSATNADGTGPLIGWKSNALHRTKIMYDKNGCAVFDPTHWKTQLAAPDYRTTAEVTYEQNTTQSENYVVDITYTNGNGDYTSVVTYSDGLGRTTQTVNIGASPTDQQDIVSFAVYDCMGRSDSVSYLPYVSSSLSGSFRTNAKSEQQSFYCNEYAYDYLEANKDYPFARKEYDKSGLGLVLKSGGVGETFQLNRNPITYGHTLSQPYGTIKKYGIADNNVDLVYKGIYSQNELFAESVTQNTQANSKNITIEYFDAAGQLVAREQHISANDRRITYYVYDNLGFQRYIIPPSVDQTANATLEQLKDNCFYTEYDDYGRAYKQYVPGASYSLSIYDKRGRLALSQDGNQRDAGKWAFTKYDDLDRPVMSGVISGGTYESHKAALESQTVFGEWVDVNDYLNRCYPFVNESDILTLTFYDRYIDDVQDYYWVEQSFALNNTPNYYVKGLVTAKKVRVLDSDGAHWLTTAYYYDDKYRVIQTISDLYPQGREIVSNAYDYTGNVIEARVRQTVEAGIVEYRKWFNYDSHGRLLSIDQQITGDSENSRVTIASYTYDELGKVTEKKLHNNLETCTYQYDIAGSNTKTSTSFFSYQVNSQYPATTTSTPRYDGKPSSFSWSRPGQSQHGYEFSYDKCGQIMASRYNELSPQTGKWGQTWSFYEGDFLYDYNGNIIQIARLDSEGDNLHDMWLDYNGNQLISLVNNGIVYTGYTYDKSGNLTCDPVEDIHIEYNELNLPSRIFGNGGEIRYIYNSEGQKLATLSDGSFTYYRSVMVYGGDDNSDEHLLYITHPDGITAYDANGNFTYKYFFNDYMGNVRSVASVDTNSATLIEEQATDYYPFGLAHSYNNLHKNRYLFSGKELQDASVGASNFLGLYDFGARYYNPMLGRWFNIDPALQTTNPYLFCGNAPTAYIDKDGRLFWLIPVAAAIIGGAVNVAANWDSIDGFWQGLTTFAVGAGAGVATAYSGGLGAGAVVGVSAAGGSVVSFSNSIVSQTGNNFSGMGQVDWGRVGKDTAIGTVASAAGSGTGVWASNAKWLTINGVNSPLLRSVAVSPLTSGVSHVAGGTVAGMLDGQNFGDSFENSFSGIGKSVATGIALSASSTLVTSFAQGQNPIDGKRWNPTHNGFKGKPQERTLQPGEIIDRYGDPQGGYYAPEGTPVENRSLHPNTNANTLTKYEVVKPFTVQEGKAASFYYQRGGGTQYYSPTHTSYLLENGYIRQVNY